MSYYCDQIEQHHGFVEKMGTLGPGEENVSVLRPYGVWAVISPFNFPLALAAGPAGGALAAGNTVVFKPASDTPLHGRETRTRWPSRPACRRASSISSPGRGSTVGQELIDNAGIDGIVFTGSKEVGMKLMRDNAARPVPRPLIIEMGGKNPAIVTASADLDKASDGVMRSAFGAQGQKCSACSRVYIQKDVRDKFVRTAGREDEADQGRQPARTRRLDGTGHQRSRRQDLPGGDRAREEGRREDSHGRPADNRAAVRSRVLRRAHRSSTACRRDHPLFSEELFVPITVVADVMTLDEALELANRTEYGLTAGIYSENEGELETFFDRIQAGVTYANRRAGATTGAWPGINPFGGWKASGSTGRGTGGPYYVQQFMREQSRVRVRGV